MEYDQHRKIAGDQSVGQIDQEAANDSVNQSELQEYEASADVYERRWRHKIRHDRRDWWVAAAVYLLLASVAFVAL
jgi:hypothetical protein